MRKLFLVFLFSLSGCQGNGVLPEFATEADIIKVCDISGVKVVYSTPDAINAEAREREVPVQAESFTDFQTLQIWVPVPDRKAPLTQKPNMLLGYELNNFCYGQANDTLGR